MHNSNQLIAFSHLYPYPPSHIVCVYLWVGGALDILATCILPNRVSHNEGKLDNNLLQVVRLVCINY